MQKKYDAVHRYVTLKKLNKNNFKEIMAYQKRIE